MAEGYVEREGGMLIWSRGGGQLIGGHDLDQSALVKRSHTLIEVFGKVKEVGGGCVGDLTWWEAGCVGDLTWWEGGVWET